MAHSIAANAALREQAVRRRVSKWIASIRRKSGAAIAVSLVAMSLTGAASADTISYVLTAANLKGLGGPYAQVMVDLTSPTTATVTFDSLRNGDVTYLMGGRGAIDVNVNGAFSLGAVSGSNSMSGFTPGAFHDGARAADERLGSFNLSLGTRGWHHSSSEVSFALTAMGGNRWNSAAEVLLPNNMGEIAAIHVIPCRANADGDGCASSSGRGNRTRGFASGALLDPPPAPLTAVPLPAAAWLFGPGLLGLMAIARRRNSQTSLPAPTRMYVGT